jgi:predicted dehydrogenase
MQHNKKQKLGMALVGLGTYSSDELRKALKETEHCELTAIVTGDIQKSEKWKREFNLKDESVYSYETFDDIKHNSEVDIVYIVLPNDMHAEFVIRAANAGKHVITEKPMDTNVEDCNRMISACKNANVKLSIGYRLHFDPFNKEMMRLGQNQLMGAIKKIIAKNGMDVGEKDQWRLKKTLAGGGPLMDLGVYCVQGVIYTLGELPISVNARFKKKTDADKFKEVEEGIEWQMKFPGGVTAFCESSYSEEYNLLRAETENGWFELSPAYEYRGLKGNSSNGPLKFAEVNQQALQMDDFAICIKENRESRVPGEMGLRDVQILMAIYESAETGKQVELHLEPFEDMIEM